MPRQSISAQAIIFDMDGVITNTMPDHFHSWKTVLKSIGIPVTYYDVYCREGQQGIRSVKEICVQYGKSVSKHQAHRILREKEILFKKIVRSRFITGARTLVKKLHRDKFRLALVTGTSRHEMERILPRPVRELFEVVVTGNDVHHGKPHPEPYLKSLKKLNVQPARAVVIENAPFGIRSAKKAGLRCLALETSLPRKYLEGADAIFASISELEHRVRFHNIPPAVSSKGQL
ncbi:MAG: HAD family phosphatase [Candidatus Omnitrophica bacterium]|nr:HAD family phosphatase [Candidatus Omnitrophota bacterium]